MNPIVVLVALLAVAVIGCKRQETASISSGSADTATAQASAQPGPPIETPTETTVVAAGADADATLAELSQQLRTYVSSTRSRPKDFQDFITRARIQAPPPPAGKAYAISSGKVVLVKQ